MRRAPRRRLATDPGVDDPKESPARIDLRLEQRATTPAPGREPYPAVTEVPSEQDRSTSATVVGAATALFFWVAAADSAPSGRALHAVQECTTPRTSAS